MNNRSSLIFGAAGLLFLLAYSSLFVVKQTERAVLLRFGAVVKADIPPGLYFRWPIAEDVKLFDGRILTFDSEAERY